MMLLYASSLKYFAGTLDVNTFSPKNPGYLVEPSTEFRAINEYG